MNEQQRPPGQLIPTAQVLTGVVSVQFGAGFAGLLFAHIAPVGAAFARLAIAAAILAVVVRPRWSRWTMQQRRGVLALGLALAVMNGAFYEAIARLPLGIAVTIEFLGPLALAAALTRRGRDALWVALALAGVAVLGLTGGHAEGHWDWAGVGFALVAGAAWAGYILAGSSVAATLPSSDGLAGASIVAALLVAPFGLVAGAGDLLDPTVLAIGTLVALLSSVIPYSLELRALRVLHKKVFAILIALDPAVAALAGALVLGQLLGVDTLVGIALVVCAGIGSVVTGRR
ncbi:EamA family transporter [Rhodococcus rhodnii]|uniref:Transporter protein n=2 Tax=Rhodococcus rhodnii TaxID=38312 RepID=R7WJS5_9NOCA|nr:EamA family transporter [Rhodococcus rhodnii]EOM75558.1 transporter protein [Rhodococcus rhodnii LMG 5362]TXG91909.1 EamA family transporter [Rhodococcus rhodnii]